MMPNWELPKNSKDFQNCVTGPPAGRISFVTIKEENGAFKYAPAP